MSLEDLVRCLTFCFCCLEGISAPSLAVVPEGSSRSAVITTFENFTRELKRKYEVMALYHEKLVRGELNAARSRYALMPLLPFVKVSLRLLGR